MQKNIYIILILILMNKISIFCESKITDERRFQLGFGFILGTHSLAGMFETNNIKNNSDYYYPLASDKKDRFESLNSDQKTGILVGHILGGWEYGFQFRILWRIFIAETDIILTPFDAVNNGRLDFVIMPMIGIKGPLALMPYIMAGTIFTFSYYPWEYSFLESQKSNFASNDKFAFRPGLNIKAGVEFKVPRYLKPAKFSVGGYLQYTIKDFEEFHYIYWNYKNSGYSNADAALKVLSHQVRFGISLCYYIF